MNDQRRWFFVHLQKTAGTALFRRLRHGLGTEAVYPLPEEQGTPATVLSVERLQDRLGETGEQFRVVTGHFPLATVDRLGGTWETFTILRDPIERVLSFVRHQREVEPRFRGWSLEAIYDDPISRGPLVRDHMVRMLSLRDEEMTDGALTPVDLDPGRLDAAVDALEHRIDVWGVQERFEELCDRLQARFGWDLGPPVFMNRTTPVPASDALRDRIEQDNVLDVELYRRALILDPHHTNGI